MGGRLLIGLIVTAMASAAGAADKPPVFKAGAAASNITPPLDEPIVGGWSPQPATHVHDELHARCLVLDNGETKLVLVLVDGLGVSREICDAATSVIREKTGIPAECVVIAATHTHSSIRPSESGPSITDDAFGDYRRFLIRRIADGVRRATNNLEPARIGWGRAEAPAQVFNRRYFMKPGTPIPNPFGGEDRVVMNPRRGSPDILKAAGPTDPEIVFIAVQSRDGRPIALLANYSLHYVGTRAGATISADYFGVFAGRIQELLGADRQDPPFVGILSNGASADINNINWPRKPEKRWPPYAKMRQVADDVARAVHDAYQRVEFHDWAALDARRSELLLRARIPTPAQLRYAREILSKPEDAKPYHRRERTYANRVLNLKDAPETLPVTLQTIRIGDLAVCAIPFEVFVEIGLELKQKSPFGKTFTISHANGGHGYLPTAKQHELGGYETWLGTSKVETQAADKIVKRLLQMLNELRAPAKPLAETAG